MPPKRPVETLVLSSDEEYSPPVASTSRSRLVSRSKSPSSTVAGMGEEEDPDLALALRISLEEANKGKENRQASAPAIQAGRGESRAELERARLERQRQWEATRPKIATTPTIMATTTKRPRIATIADLAADDESSTSSHGRPPSSSRASPSDSVPKVFQRFYKGAVRRVANQWYPDSDSFAFKELVGPPSTLRGAVVSAYCLDEEWIAENLPDQAFLLYVRPRQTGEATPDFAEYAWRPNTYRVIPKDKTQNPRGGVMHTKLLIFYHEDFCRVVIPTANAVSYDWSQIDNAFYVHDFPRRRSPSPVDEESNPFRNPTHTQFSKKFFQVCYCAFRVSTLFLGPGASQALPASPADLQSTQTSAFPSTSSRSRSSTTSPARPRSSSYTRIKVRPRFLVLSGRI